MEIKVGDVFEVTKDIQFVQPPLLKYLQKGQKLWVKEAGKYWPILEANTGDYAYFGEVVNTLIESGDIVKREPLEYPFEYYKSMHTISVLRKKMKEEHEKIKKIISENDL